MLKRQTDIKDFINQEIQEAIVLKNNLFKDLEYQDIILRTALTCVEALKAQNKILCIGNGGSAADSQHIAAEFISRFYFDRPSLPAIALTTDTSILTAIGNDYGFEEIFSRQISGLGNRGDILFAFSTSGSSPNVIKALKAAKQKDIKIVSFTSIKDQNMKQFSDFYFQIPSKNTARIQECHIFTGHLLCAIIEKEMFQNEK